MSGAAPLDGVRVLVTRPAHQADALVGMIERAGGTALRMPALAIAGPADPGPLAAVAQTLDRYDIAIFVSPNAVEGATRLLGRPFGARTTLFAIGPATARALALAGYPEALCADHPFNSEALLALRELQQVAGQRAVIFRGDGGRGLLARVLAERGAVVEYAEVYRRAPPPPPAPEVAAALRRRQVDAVTATSGEVLEQLAAMCTDDLYQGLTRAQLVVASDRMVKLAESLGFHSPLVAAEPGDGAMMEALVAWRTGRPPQETG